MDLKTQSIQNEEKYIQEESMIILVYNFKE